VDHTPLALADLHAVVDGARALLELVRDIPVSRLRLTYGQLSLDVEGRPAPAAAPATALAPESAVGSIPVTAPLVGVFYRRPAPDQPPFVEVGQRVEGGQQVGIVEAMKMMNVIVAERSGVVARICADDAEVVEFGQLLMMIDPS
jgi:acetyl-CoA carboxylase biotin carboxyl carrier protein